MLTLCWSLEGPAQASAEPLQWLVEIRAELMELLGWVLCGNRCNHPSNVREISCKQAQLAFYPLPYQPCTQGAVSAGISEDGRRAGSANVLLYILNCTDRSGSAQTRLLRSTSLRANYVKIPCMSVHL